MGNLFDKEPPPPPMVLVPPLFDYPPLAARTRMLESSYDLLFGKLALKSLFEDYFDQARHFSAMIMLRPIDDPHVDLVATIFGPLDHKPEETIVGNAFFRWQSDIHDPHTFVDLFVLNSDLVLQTRACAYYPRYGFGTFGVFPILLKQRISSEDFDIMGLRYGSANLSIGATVQPFSVKDELPKKAWLVSKMGSLTAGIQYEPEFGSTEGQKFRDSKNWSAAIGYGGGSGSPLSPSFNFDLELKEVISCHEWYCVNKLFVGDQTLLLYDTVHCLVLSTCGGPKTASLIPKVKNPLEENQVVGITNYIDFGFELPSRVERFDDAKTDDAEKSKKVPDPKDIPDSTFQIAASWQVNKNFLLKGKAGPLSSSVAVAFKPWWKPAFTFSISAVRDHIHGNTAFGFGIRVENLRQARADPNFIMLTPTKEHLAEGIVWKAGKRSMLVSNISAGNFDGVPMELRPLRKIL